MNELLQFWQKTVVRRRSRPAIIEGDSGRVWTVAELAAEGEQRAERLPIDVRGRLIAFCLPNGTEWIARFLAIQHCGAVAVPLDSSLTPDAQEHIARALGAQFLWGPEVAHRLGRTTRALRNTCCVKLTSGTSGKPKVVPCAAAHLIADGRHILRTMGIRAADRNLGIIPFGHSYGLGNLVMPLMMQGTAVVAATTFLPREFLRLIAQHRATVFPAVPAVLRALTQLPESAAPPSLRLVISAGGPLLADVARVFERRYGLRIHNFYGSSETGGICYDRTGAASLHGRGVGTPLSGVVVRLRRDGRVCVQSGAVAALRHQVILPDLGRWNMNGELQLVGRADMVANIGGKKVAPTEVECCLRELPGVTDAWVTVLQDSRGSDYLATAVETRLDRTGLEQALVRSLPLWKLPKRYLICEVLPRTDRGKLDTAYLRARLMTSLP